MGNKNLKKIIYAFLVCVMVSGCSTEKKVILTMEEPPWTQAKEDEMEKKYPNVDIINYGNGISIITPDSVGQENGAVISHYFFSEADKLPKSNIAKDITSYMDERGFSQAMNPQLLDMVTDNGRIYAIPYEAYALGLMANIELFQAAGLVNADGSVIFPSSYDELAETALLIKERTGKAGLALPVDERHGGWLFMPIAWSYGVEFISEEPDGSLKASFDTKECADALQYIKDLKWKYNAFTDNEIANMDEMRQAFADGEAAMMIAAMPNDPLMREYKMNRNNIAMGRMPEGPAGRYTLMGGNLYTISAEATDAQVKAAFDWFELIGFSPNVTEEMINTWERKFANDAMDGVIVTEEDVFKIWMNKETLEKQKEVRMKYKNVDMQNFADYTSFENVIIRQEYSGFSQELYEVLDIGVQEVMRNENSDVEEIVHYMVEKFQNDYLNKK